MEPLTSAIGAIGAVRPTPAASADMASLLKDGRVVAGEVLETFDGGSVVLGIAGRRVPAESHVELQPGQRFLATAETTDGEIVLRLAPEKLGEGSRLVSALRRVVGQDSPTGAILDSLASLVGTSAAESRALAALLADLPSHAFTPGVDGEALRELLLRSGLRYESALLAAEVGDNSSAWLRVAAAGEVAERWVAAWRSALPIGAPDVDLSSLRSTITTLLLEAVRELAAAAEHSGLPELDGWLKRVLDARARSASSLWARAVVEHAGAQVDASPTGTDAAALLRWLFGAPSDDGLRPLLKDVARRALERDLKGRLLGALSELEDSPGREVVERALASLETDQLMNLARRRFDQASHFSLPVPDAERWTSAQFLHPPNREQDSAANGEERDAAPQRLVIGIDFSRLGPIRADLLMRSNDLIVRLTVERAETAEALRGVVERWREDLAVGGRSVQVAVSDQPDVDVQLHAVAPDVRFLAENHLMDVSG